MIRQPYFDQTSAKMCRTCHEIKEPEDFHGCRWGDGRVAVCKKCRANLWQTQRADGRVTYASLRRKMLRLRYGILPEEAARMLEHQDNKCAMCEKALIPFGNGNRVTHIDHDHGSGLVRSILCINCNTGLRYVEDDAFRVMALSYLQRHGTPTP